MSSIGKDKKEKKLKKAKKEPEQSPVSMKVDKKSKKESKKRKALDMDVDAGDKENRSEPLNNAEPKSVLETRKTKKKKKKKKKSKKVNKAEEQEETKQNGEEAVPMTKKKSKKAKVEKGAIEEEKNVEKEKSIAVLKAKLKEIKSLSPIQAKTVDTILDGFDLMAHAATDQYKTLAFVLPILESLHGSSEQSTKKGSPSAIVLLPTKDLATQVLKEFGSYGGSLGLVSRCVSGGSSHIAQARKLRGRVDIIVGTPGRVKDQIENGIIDLSSVKFRVLAEADQLSKTWLVEHVEFILGKMKDVTNIQTLLFSTNMPRWVELIAPSRYLKSSYKKVVLPGNEKKISQSNGGFTNRRDDTFSNKGGQVAATMATDGES